MLKFAEFSSRNEVPSFSKFDVFHVFTLSPLNGVFDLLFSPEKRFQVKLLDAKRHAKANSVEVNIFAVTEHEPSLNV